MSVCLTGCCLPCSQGRDSDQVCSHGWRNHKSLPKKVLFPSFLTVSLTGISTASSVQISGVVKV